MQHACTLAWPPLPCKLTHVTCAATVKVGGAHRSAGPSVQLCLAGRAGTCSHRPQPAKAPAPAPTPAARCACASTRSSSRTWAACAGTRACAPPSLPPAAPPAPRSPAPACTVARSARLGARSAAQHTAQALRSDYENERCLAALGTHNQGAQQRRWLWGAGCMCASAPSSACCARVAEPWLACSTAA